MWVLQNVKLGWIDRTEGRKGRYDFGSSISTEGTWDVEIGVVSLRK